ncbi:MAG: DUF3944 domain-containing protein [Anaerovoracaceae bacterium]
MNNNTLAFINTASNEDLRTLCDIITLDKDGSPRLTEELTGTAGYRMNYPGNMRALAPEMVDEFRRFGGNTFANIVRGEGPEYSEILRDVAKRQKVKIKSGDSDEVIERHLLEKMFDNISKTMTDEQLKEMMDQMGIHLKYYSREAAVAALQLAIREGGFACYKWLVVVANALAKFLTGRGLTIAANAALTKWLSVFAGPIGWAVTALWTVIDIAGPAYRVTIPAVIQIAYMRQKPRYAGLLTA